MLNFLKNEFMVSAAITYTAKAILYSLFRIGDYIRNERVFQLARIFFVPLLQTIHFSCKEKIYKPLSEKPKE
jgi:hypothetical protein